jgi:hypothetical protein
VGIRKAMALYNAIGISSRGKPTMVGLLGA